METQAVLTRRAVFAPPDTFDADAGTVEAVISTFAPPVQRKGFMERLDPPAGLDTSRLIGAPVLDGHRQGSARDVIGTITGHRMEDGKLVAMIRLSGGAADAAPPIVERIREGTIKGVSIGYRVTRWAESTDPNSRARVRTAAAWSISEVSAVPIPADPGSQFRGESMENEDLQVENTEDNTTETRAAIRQICRSAGMTAEQADDMIDRDLTITEARAEAFEAMQRRTPPARIRTAAPPANDDPPAVTMTRRADALYARVSGEAPPTDEARPPYMGETLRDMARAAVEASGQSTRSMDADTLFRAAMHTTSDFPQLLTSTGNRTLTAAYQAAQSPPVKTALARRSTMRISGPAPA